MAINKSTEDVLGKLLTHKDAAKLAGITESTWRAYVARGQAPPPDGKIGDTPIYQAKTIKDYLGSRPGRGVHPKDCTCKRCVRGRELDTEGRPVPTGLGRGVHARNCTCARCVKRREVNAAAVAARKRPVKAEPAPEVVAEVTQ